VGGVMGGVVKHGGESVEPEAVTSKRR
jgi:hypothetical protein